MTDDNKSDSGNANFGKDGKLTEAFSKERDIEAMISSLSPEGQKNARFLQELASQKREEELKSQKRHHAHRVLATKVEMLEKYIRSPHPRPESVKADPSPDLDIIDQEAERTVCDRERYFLDKIEQQATTDIRQLVVNERKGQQPDHEPDNEPDRER